MSVPKHEIIIGDGGIVQFEGMEKSDQCFKLSEIAGKLGKVVSTEKKEHVPVFQDVHQRSV